MQCIYSIQLMPIWTNRVWSVTCHVIIKAVVRIGADAEVEVAYNIVYFMDNTSFLALGDAARAMFDASPQWMPYALTLGVGYPLLTTSLRYRRRRKLHQQFHYPTRESMAQMTDKDAFEIQKAVAQLEFPFMFIKSLQFALFRVDPPSSSPGIIPIPKFPLFQTNTRTRPMASQPYPASSPKQASSQTQRPR